MRLTARERRLIVLAGVVAAFAVLWVVVVEPVFKAHQSLSARLHEEEELLAWEQFLAENSTRILAATAYQEKLLSDLRGNVREGDYVTTAIGDIQRLAKGTGLQLSEVRPQASFSGMRSVPKLKTTTLQVTATGTFAQFAGFLALLHDERPAYEMTRLRIGATQPGALEFSLQVDVAAPALLEQVRNAGTGGPGSQEKNNPEYASALLRSNERRAEDVEKLVSRRVGTESYALLLGRDLFGPAQKAAKAASSSVTLSAQSGRGQWDGHPNHLTPASSPGVGSGAKSDPPRQLYGVELTGIVVIGQTRYVLLHLPGGEETYYREGEEIAGFRVGSIGEDYVVLRNGKVSARLKLRDEFSVVPLTGNLSRGGN